MPLRGLPALLLLAASVVGEDAEWAQDDECLAAGQGGPGQGCALSAVQKRAASLAAGDRETAHTSKGEVVAGWGRRRWDGDSWGRRRWDGGSSTRRRSSDSCMSDWCQRVRKDRGHNSYCENGVSREHVKIFDASCENHDNCCCNACYLWSNAKRFGGEVTCPSGGKVLTAGGKVIPPDARVTGNEAIKSLADARRWNYLWSCAWQEAGGSVATRRLVANPFTARSQHVLHIHYGALSGAGKSKVVKLSRFLGCRKSNGWAKVAGIQGLSCRNNWIKTYKPGSLPSDVYTEVSNLAQGPARAAGRLYKGSLGTFGISVISICASRQQGGCSPNLDAFTCDSYMPAIVAGTSGTGGCFPEGVFVK